MNKQPEALRLADEMDDRYYELDFWDCREAAYELRRLHEVNQELLAVLEKAAPELEYMAGGMTHAPWKTKQAQECLSLVKNAIAKAKDEVRGGSNAT